MHTTFLIYERYLCPHNSLTHSSSILVTNGRIPLEHLLISQRLSREISAYRVPSPACRAAMQLAAIGKPRRPRQRLRFWYVRGEVMVHAWDLEAVVETAVLDTDRYTTLLLRAPSAILQPLGMSEAELQQAVLADAWQLPFSFHQGNMFAFGIKWYAAVKKRTRQGSRRQSCLVSPTTCGQQRQIACSSCGANGWPLASPVPVFGARPPKYESKIQRRCAIRICNHLSSISRIDKPLKLPILFL